MSHDTYVFNYINRTKCVGLLLKIRCSCAVSFDYFVFILHSYIYIYISIQYSIIYRSHIVI